MIEIIKVLAKLEYPISREWRQGPFFSGYRPIFSFETSTKKNSGKIDLQGKDAFTQGDVGIVEITFIKGLLNDECFTAGEKFTFAENPYPVGKGQIIENM